MLIKNYLKNYIINYNKEIDSNFINKNYTIENIKELDKLYNNCLNYVNKWLIKNRLL